MRRLLILVIALLIGATTVAALPAAPSISSADPGLLPVDAVGTVPPASLLKERANGKLSTDLVQLVDAAARLPGQTRETIARGLRGQQAYRGTPGTRGAGTEAVFVYVSLFAGSPTSLVDAYAVEVTDRDEKNRLVAAWISPDRLTALASQAFVRTIRTVDPPRVNTGSVTTEGDALLRSDTFRSTLGHAGRGMKIGVISDGVDSWEAARDTGDLPADVHVLSNTRGGDEGTAMLEIVHDIAPDAELYFHDMSSNQIGFNSGITALADAGCQVIVDDIIYLAEPAFEDGIIASHVSALVETRNIIYVSSAGNDGYTHYQGLFTPEVEMPTVHNFTNGAPSDSPRLYANLSPGSEMYTILHWDDRWGHSGNDYDLAVYRRGSYASPIGVSNDRQAGSGDPIEGVYVQNTGSTYVDVEINVTKYAGDARTLEIYFYTRNARIQSDNIVRKDSISGHAAAVGAIAVAAADVASPASLEAYSSWGPSTIRWPSTELRQKPEIAGPDGNLISGAGNWGRRDGSHYRFFGTSASAPHVAALAALIWSGQPTASASQVRSALLETADDRGAAGFDYGWGHGWPNALAFGRALGVAQVRGPGGGVPQAAFGVSQQSGPAPLTVRFLDYSTGAATWRWDFGDGTTTVEHEPLHTYASPGRYTVSLTVANGAGAANTTTKYDYVVAGGPAPTPTPAPTVEVNFTANATAGPAPLTVRFTDASGGSPYHWWWQFGDGGTSTDANPVHTYTKAGTYTVNLSVWTATGSSSVSKPALVTVGADLRAPTANFSLSRETGTAPLYVRFTDTSTGAPTSWRWDFGGLAWTTASSPTVVFRQPGTYAVTQTATNAYGTSTATRNVTVTGRAAPGAASIAVVG